MRKAPPAPSPIAKAPAFGNAVCDERVYRFLTPVFGGGVEVNGQIKPHDPVTAIRVPSIRGQLRFWWRACNPSRCSSSKELWEREGKVFGSTTAQSPLAIAVRNGPERTRDVPVFKDRFAVVDGREGRAYGAFPLREANNGPLREANNGTNHGVLHEHLGEWALAIRYNKDFEHDIEAAFWAWAHFGGLGGRVRRGFGAIEEVRRGTGKLASIEEGWERFVSGLEGLSWPHLPPASKKAKRLRTKTGKFDSGADAQDYLLNLMRRLRQGDIGRKRDADDVPGRHPGRSYWPEPDTIRALTGMRSPDHKKPVTQVQAFPRAAFGLPIIFHFKDRRDPMDTTLVPRVDGVDKGRLASPLLLRPHRAENGSIEAFAVALNHPEPDELVLNNKKPNPPKAKWKTLSKSEAVSIGLGGRPSPLVTTGGAVIADPIERFLEEIR